MAQDLVTIDAREVESVHEKDLENFDSFTVDVGPRYGTLIGYRAKMRMGRKRFEVTKF